jgi:6-phosphogluconate dehydrogenase (decarboxylating)
MKVLTEDGLMGFAKAIAENHRPTESTVEDLFNFYAEGIVHGWTKHDVAEEMCRIFKGAVCDDIVLLIELSDEIDLDLVLEKVGKADPSSGIGEWTIEWAIEEIYNCEVSALVERLSSPHSN